MQEPRSSFSTLMVNDYTMVAVGGEEYNDQEFPGYLASAEYIDLRNPENGWKYISLMSCPIGNTIACSLGPDSLTHIAVVNSIIIP